MSENKAKFTTQLGVIAATVGSAVGLGNVWRFPAEAQANGGAAFLLVYVLCVFILGIPVMMAEFSLGRAGNSDAIGVFKNLKASRWWYAVGGTAILASYAILCFYMVVTGWTLEYLWQSISGTLYEPVTTAMPEGVGLNPQTLQFTQRMHEFIEVGMHPLINTYIVILINVAVLIIGVQKGIERLANILMPLLFLILLAFCGVAMTLPEAKEGLSYFLKPDFSAITPTVCINALGQSFFSLSLGMGILVTYASYYKSDTRLGRTALTVSLLDMLVAVMMGVIIFPAVVSFGLTGEALEGTTLVFVTLPEVFAQLPGTRFWSALFFLLLFVAALTSTISIAEVSVAFVTDRFGMSRIKSTLLVLTPLFALSSLCAKSSIVFATLDSVATNILLPLVSIGICIYVGWFAPKGMLKAEITNNGNIKGRILPVIRLIIRYVAPVLIALVMISGLIG